MGFAYLISAWPAWIPGIPFINLLIRSFGVLCLAGVLLIMISSCASDSNTEYFEEIGTYREKLNIEFSDTASSPLTKEGLAHFQELEFFPIDPEYRVEASFILNPDPDPFEMPTNTTRKPIYVKYGEAHFELHGQDIVLEIYQSEAAKKMKEFKEYLFLPFKDLTNGNESYGGGRFLDLKIPAGKTIIIDFNKAYNPYCDYNHKYSCPIPPEVNHLNIEIPAGVKAYKDY